MGKLCKLSLLLLALLLRGACFAQSLIDVRGCVTDEQNEPIIGATVQTKDKSKGTVTDAGGNYLLSGVPKGTTLVFSYVGCKPVEKKASSGSLNVVLVASNEMLNELVVIGYGQQRKVTLTGSVSNVSGKELLKSPAASLGNSLAGKLPGLQSVQYTGVPGGDDPVIRIRGIGSFNSAEPLVLVDGVEREFSQIDPNEVQDISILKDASATAVFGVRGANGVILVTTRRGEVGKPTISLTTSAGLQQISRFLEPASSYEYATAYNHAQEVEGVAEDGWKFSKEAIQHWKDMDMPTVYPNTNWFTYLMNDHAWQEQYNINVSGGTERARYFVSVGMLNQNGLFKTFDQGDDANFKYRRYNFRANLDVDFSKWSTLSIGIGGRVGRRNSIGNGEYNGQSGVFGVEGLLNNGTPMSGYGLDDNGRNGYAVNIGGWNNRTTAVQPMHRGRVNDTVSRSVRQTIDTNRWYDVKISVTPQAATLFVDGKEITVAHPVTQTRQFCQAGYDEQTGELVIKVVNGTDKPYRRSFTIDGAKNVMPTGKVITINGDAKDENTFEQPTKLAPQTTLYGKFGKQFQYEFAPMSFTIMRVKADL